MLFEKIFLLIPWQHHALIFTLINRHNLIILIIYYMNHIFIICVLSLMPAIFGTQFQNCSYRIFHSAVLKWFCLRKMLYGSTVHRDLFCIVFIYLIVKASSSVQRIQRS